MYVLLKFVGDDTIVVEAVSKDKSLLVQRMRKKGKRIIEDYYEDDDYGQTIKEELLKSIATATDEWSDGDEECPLAFKIVDTDVLKPKTKKKHLYTKFAFGREIQNRLEEVENKDDVLKLVEEYNDTENIVIRQFNTEAERRAYLMGLNDCYGWDRFMDIKMEYPSLAKWIPNKPNIN